MEQATIEKCRKLRNTYDYSRLFNYCTKVCYEAINNPDILPNWITASGLDVVDDNTRFFKLKFGHYVVAKLPKHYCNVYDSLVHAFALLLEVDFEKFKKVSFTRDQAVYDYLSTLPSSNISDHITVVETKQFYKLRFQNSDDMIVVYDKVANKSLNGAFYFLRLDNNPIYSNSNNN